MRDYGYGKTGWKGNYCDKKKIWRRNKNASYVVLRFFAKIYGIWSKFDPDTAIIYINANKLANIAYRVV